MKKVLFIAPQFISSDYPIYLPSENLGIAYIAAYLRSKNIEVDIFDANMLGMQSIDVVKNINVQEYCLIGLSLSFEGLLNEGVIIAQQIKKMNSKVHISVGGHFPTFQHEAILEEYKSIDSVIRGDGEITCYELYNAIRNKRNLENVEGLTFRFKNQIIINPDRPLLHNLDELPWPARDTLEYVKNKGHNWPTQITTSRGCYGHCVYCDITSFYKATRRARSAEDVVDEIEYLIKKYNCKTFRFTDDNFVGKDPDGPSRARKFAHEIIERNIKANFMISARAEDIDEELLILLGKAGVNDCCIGIESGVDRILKLYNKQITVADNQRCIDLLRKTGINLNLAFIMIDPRMTINELIQNYEFLKKNQLVSIDALRSSFWPLYGTPALKQFENEDLITCKKINNVQYRFLDKEVEFVYHNVKELCKKAFHLDKSFYFCAINGIELDDIDSIKEQYYLYWIEYFESIIYHGTIIDYQRICNYTDEMKKILKRYNVDTNI